MNWGWTMVAMIVCALLLTTLAYFAIVVCVEATLVLHNRLPARRVVVSGAIARRR